MTRESLIVNGVAMIVGAVMGWFACYLFLTHPEIARRHAAWRTNKMDKAPRKFRLDYVGVTILVGVVLILVIGWQAYAANQQRAKQDREDAEQAAHDAAQVRCISEWGKETIRTIKIRTQSSAAERRAARQLARAETRKGNAMDNIILVVVGARAIPPQADEQDFDSALAAFVKAREARARVQERTQGVLNEARAARRANKYKQLDCGVTLPGEDQEPVEDPK